MEPQQAALSAALATGQYNVILGTSSKWRRMVLDELCSVVQGLSYSVLKADIDEKALRDPNPEKLVSMLARAKAAAIIQQMK